MQPIETQINKQNIAVDSLTHDSNSIDSSIFISKKEVSTDTLRLENIKEVFGSDAFSISRELPRNNQNSIPMLPIPFSIVLVLLISWLLIVRRFKPEIQQLMRAFFHYNLIKRVDEDKSIHMTNYLNISLCISIAVFCTLFALAISSNILAINIFDINVFLFAYSSILIVFLVRWIFTFFYKRTIGVSSVRRLFIFQKVYLSFVFLLFTPLTIIFLLSEFSESYKIIIFYTLIVTLFFSYFGFLSKFFYREKFLFNQIFLYLCLVELVPLLLMGILFLA